MNAADVAEVLQTGSDGSSRVISCHSSDDQETQDTGPPAPPTDTPNHPLSSSPRCDFTSEFAHDQDVNNSDKFHPKPTPEPQSGTAITGNKNTPPDSTFNTNSVAKVDLTTSEVRSALNKYGTADGEKESEDDVHHLTADDAAESVSSESQSSLVISENSPKAESNTLTTEGNSEAHSDEKSVTEVEASAVPRVVLRRNSRPAALAAVKTLLPVGLPTVSVTPLVELHVDTDFKPSSFTDLELDQLSSESGSAVQKLKQFLDEDQSSVQCSNQIPSAIQRGKAFDSLKYFLSSLQD